MRRLGKILLGLLVLAAIGYYPLVLHSPKPGQVPYRLDLGQARTLAGELPGQRPQSLEVEQVATLVFAEAMVMAGEPWQATPIPVYSYRLRYADGHSIVIDTAMAGTDGIPGAMVEDFDTAALQRMNRALETADQIVLTHEHFDHIGGLLAHPRLPELLARTHLTVEQLAHEDRMRPLQLPRALFADYVPLDYAKMQPLAPGVVLIKAPGHTPGSQMVYIQLAGGREVLLIGDVAWQYRNIAAVRERPLFMTALIQESRQQVINQFQTLNELARQLPDLHIVPGHDRAVVERLIAAGVMQRGFAQERARR